jgi:hypothetical protein
LIRCELLQKIFDNQSQNIKSNNEEQIFRIHNIIIRTMRRLTVLLLVTQVFILPLIKAQHPYIPIPDNSEWVYGMIDGNCTPPFNICGYYHYRISGDTVIANYTYKKIMGTGLNDNIYIYKAAIRQNNSERRVYVVKADYFGGCSNVDTLLYDFNVEQSDTLSLCDDITGGVLNPTIESVDSILVEDSWRSRINLNLMNVPSLIEGIGSTSDFFGAWGGWIGGHNFLACYSIDGVPVYPDTLCTLVGTNFINFSKPEIKICPNPSSNRSSIRVTIRYPTFCRINIYDLTSCFIRNIFTGSLDSGINSLEFNTSDFSSGLYVIQILYEENEFNELIEIVH